MINNEQQFVLDALRTALKVKADELTAWRNVALNADIIARIILRNGILLTAYPVLTAFSELKNALQDRYFAAIKQAVEQDYYGRMILLALNNASFDCIALKGWELRKLYPEITMRQMADLDILIRPYDYRRINDCLLCLGFQGDSTESSWMHDKFSKNFTTLETHKRLTDDSGAIQEWERHMWEHVVHTDDGDHIFCMSNEDFYIFHIVHMHKDFLNGALGLRRIADTWLFTHTHSQMDQKYLTDAFDKMGLSLFAERMITLSKAAMGEIEMDENSEIMLIHAFQHGIYGSDKSYKLGRIATMSSGNLKKGKLHSLVAAIFLPYSRMKAHFPILQKWPILLPMFWIKRICRHLHGDLKKKKQMLTYSNLDEEDYKTVKEFFSAGGV